MVMDERGRFVGFKDPNVIYIGRSYYRGGYALEGGTPWQNRYSVKKYGRAGAIQKYREDLLATHERLARLPELRGKILACWCNPDEACHGDVLLELLQTPALYSPKHR